MPDSFTPPAAADLPLGVLDAAVSGASMLDARAATDYGRNVIAHALVQLQRDGWLRDAPEAEPRPLRTVRCRYVREAHEPHEYALDAEIIQCAGEVVEPGGTGDFIAAMRDRDPGELETLRAEAWQTGGAK